MKNRILKIFILSLTVSLSFFNMDPHYSHIAFATTANDLRSQQTDLNVIWEVSPNNQDKMSTSDPNEASKFPMDGQIYYIPKNPSDKQNTLNRLYNRVNDHMDSLLSNEGSYSYEGPIGYPWKSTYAPIGTSLMFRGYNPSTGDHSLMSDNLQFNGYTTKEYFNNCYGYPRFGANIPLFTLAGSQLTINSNLAAGGAIWEYWWNNKQFVDDLDYGRQIQSSLSFTDSTALPTEAGSCAYDTYDKNYLYGSPIASYSNNVTTTKKTQSTRAIPSEFNPASFNGGYKNIPVIYSNWQLGKNITIDDASMNLGQGFEYLNNRVAKYETVFNSPITLTNAQIEIPTGYLRGEFNRAFTFDSTITDINDAKKEVFDFTYLGNGIYQKQYNVSSGGVIYATSDLSYAMGVYGSTPDKGGSVDYFTLWKFGSLQSPSATKWAAVAGPKTINSGENKYTTYIITGTFDDVRVAMRRLYLQGYR